MAQALPQLQLLDRLPLADDRDCLAQQQGPAAEHMAQLQLQAYQPQAEIPQVQHPPAAAPVSEAADASYMGSLPWPAPMTYLQGTPALQQDLTYLQCMQQLPSLPQGPRLPEALHKDEVQNLADKLARRLAQSRVALPDEAAADAAKQEQRWASMEARLSALLEGRLSLPDEAHVPRAAGSRSRGNTEAHTSDQHAAAGCRSDGACQKQQPARLSWECSGCRIAPSAVQGLQVGGVCPAHLRHLATMHVKPTAI